MSEEYIRNHFADIKNYANIIENRLDDEWCTMERVLADNAEMLVLAQRYNVNSQWRRRKIHNIIQIEDRCKAYPFFVANSFYNISATFPKQNSKIGIV